eukprot:354041-Chlamydomonas_euryale.AAC.12
MPCKALVQGWRQQPQRTMPEHLHEGADDEMTSAADTATMSALNRSPLPAPTARAPEGRRP